MPAAGMANISQATSLEIFAGVRCCIIRKSPVKSPTRILRHMPSDERRIV
nr:MAG TPA: hypothetical protein [Caudoviricetes sp.]